jgi:nicotinamide-nucleotide amidase
MKAEVLATGDEIRSGMLVDSNSAYLARHLQAAGFAVVRHTVVGDDLDALVSIFSEIGLRSDVAVVTGGLGPTPDDRTAQAAARAAGVDLVLDKQSLKSIENFFSARGRPMSPSNKRQALLPQGALGLANPIGTAPGFALRINKCMFFFLPGVPHEMRQMMSASILPHLRRLLGDARIHYQTTTISTFGFPESVAAELLSGFGNRFPDVDLGFRAKFPEIQIKLYGQGSDKDSLQTKLADAARWIRDRMGGNVFSENGTSMENVIGDLLGQKNETLAVAESCTGGLISDLLTNVPGSSEYFLFSGVVYANLAKANVLGVSWTTIDSYGAVHEETAKEMAAGAKRVSGATYGLSTSGIAGPGGGSVDKPVGTLCIGLATPKHTLGKRYQFPDLGRLRNKQLFAMKALDILRCEILGIVTENKIAIVQS